MIFFLLVFILLKNFAQEDVINAILTSSTSDILNNKLHGYFQIERLAEAGYEWGICGVDVCYLSIHEDFNDENSRLLLQPLTSLKCGEDPAATLLEINGALIDDDDNFREITRFATIPVTNVSEWRLCGCLETLGYSCDLPPSFREQLGVVQLIETSLVLLPRYEKELYLCYPPACDIYIRPALLVAEFFLFPYEQPCSSLSRIEFKNSGQGPMTVISAKNKEPFSCESDGRCHLEIHNSNIGIWRLCGCSSNTHVEFSRKKVSSSRLDTNVRPVFDDGFDSVSQQFRCSVNEKFISDFGVVFIPSLKPFLTEAVMDSMYNPDLNPERAIMDSDIYDIYMEVLEKQNKGSVSHQISQYAEMDEASDSIRKVDANNTIISKLFSRKLQETDTNDPVKCTTDTDCLKRFGKCQSGRCRGFQPDLNDERQIRCVDGYNCNIKEGDIPGVDVGPDFQVISIPINEKCGAVDPLKSAESIFANSNRWECASLEPNSCLFFAGVGSRRNHTLTTESIRLCGCPNIDGDASGIPCDNRREFYVPLGKLSVQECLRNAHCADHQFAYCVDDHCAGASGIISSYGIKAFECVMNRDCDVRTMTWKSFSEAMKVLPIASTFSCGADVALDPDYIQDDALPCVADIDNDGICDINLGIAKTLGTTRLCGCSGDKGGNGRNCDQLEDFDQELGVVTVGECMVDLDCPKRGDLCINQSCIRDTMPPYVIKTIPGNSSFAVPPINEVVLTWNENVKFTKANRKLVIACATCEEPKKWEVEVKDPSTYKVAEAGYSIKLKGRKALILNLV